MMTLIPCQNSSRQFIESSFGIVDGQILSGNKITFTKIINIILICLNRIQDDEQHESLIANSHDN